MGGGPRRRTAGSRSKAEASRPSFPQRLHPRSGSSTARADGKRPGRASRGSAAEAEWHERAPENSFEPGVRHRCRGGTARPPPVAGTKANLIPPSATRRHAGARGLDDIGGRARARTMGGVERAPSGIGSPRCSLRPPNWCALARRGGMDEQLSVRVASCPPPPHRRSPPPEKLPTPLSARAQGYGVRCPRPVSASPLLINAPEL